MNLLSNIDVFVTCNEAINVQEVSDGQKLACVFSISFIIKNCVMYSDSTMSSTRMSFFFEVVF